MLLPYLILLTSLVLHTASSTPKDFRLELTHVDAAGNFTKTQLLLRAALRSKTRMESLVRSTRHPITRVGVPVRPSDGEYLLELTIGTPPLSWSAILDTGSDLIYTQCQPCLKCQPQPTALYDPSRSSTFSKLPCDGHLCKALPLFSCTPDCSYAYSYADNSSTRGVLAAETFTFGARQRATIPHLAFGCSLYNEGSTFNSSGLVGFGRGPLSLVSQLRVRKFSYCYTPMNESKTSPLFFGSLANLNRGANGRIGSTRLIHDPSNPSFYYLSLEGITVGATRLPIPKSTFALQKDGTGGLIIDSGTSITRLEEAGFRVMKEAFVSQVKLPVANITIEGLALLCFSLPAGSSPAALVPVPKLIFHFEGADLEFERENYMVMDEENGLLCLTITASNGLSIWGNFQQQNLHILYDLGKEKLSFVRAQCERL